MTFSQAYLSAIAPIAASFFNQQRPKLPVEALQGVRKGNV
jgi:hypothetical protein